MGQILLRLGDWQAGMEACRFTLEHASDPHSATLALGYLGLAYLEQGDAAQAIPPLEQALRQLIEWRIRRMQSQFMSYLSEAQRLTGHVERAHELAFKALEIATDAEYPYGVGWAQRALGRSAQASGALAEAEAYLKAAFETFAAIQARFELSRTHLALAELAYAQENCDALTTHLAEAHALFSTLQLPHYVERTEQLAEQCRVPLSGRAVAGTG
jgi:tetratricopeptide (TPR) repeat protein